MKTTRLLLLLLFLASLLEQAGAQSRKIFQKNGERTIEEPVVNARQSVSISFVQNQMQITNLQTDGFDKILVFNMQGAVALQQNVKSVTATIDLSPYPDGVYLLVLRSSVHLKEKTMKFVLKK